MAARPNPDDYNLPTRWVPVSGELARGRCLISLSETERLIFYNQDVLYHQNLEILQMLDELRAQNKHASPESTTNLQTQTVAAPEEAESKQLSVIEMQPSRVPSVRLPTAFKDEPPTPATRSPRRNAEGKRNADNLDSGKDDEREMGGNFFGGVQPGKK
ncbi:hypothetical protein MMC08_003563 [Hypocenomyce scalaris]|nr:hypothetical protein [Hypocenomyce scalaris]